MAGERAQEILLQGARRDHLRALKLVGHAEEALAIARKIECEALTRLDRAVALSKAEAHTKDHWPADLDPFTCPPIPGDMNGPHGKIQTVGAPIGPKCVSHSDEGIDDNM